MSDNKSLYSLNAEFLELQNKLMIQEGELLPEQEAMIMANLTSTKDKVTDYCLLNASIDHECARVSEQIQQALAYVQKLQGVQKKISLVAMKVLESRNWEPLEGTVGHKISTRKSVSTFVEPGYHNQEGTKLPIELLRTKTTMDPDLKLIKAKLEAGEVIEGCRLIEKRNISWK